MLQDAFAELGSDYHLLLVGGGESKRLTSNITLMPYRRDSTELATVIASCDALVHAGTAETFASWCSKPWPAAARWWACARRPWRSW